MKTDERKLAALLREVRTCRVCIDAPIVAHWRVPMGAGLLSRYHMRTGEAEGATPESRRPGESEASRRCLPPRSARSYFAPPPHCFTTESTSQGGLAEDDAEVRQRYGIEQADQEVVAAKLASEGCELKTEQKIDDGES